MIDLDAPAIYEKIIHETEADQVRLVVNTFRDVEYISLRKYYMDLDFDNSRNLFEGLVEILSLAESKAILEDNFKDLLDEIYL